MWEWVVEYFAVGFENIPVLSRDVILNFMAIESSKVEWVMDDCFIMCQVKPFTKRK
jgi:hypothetical protein